MAWLSRPTPSRKSGVVAGASRVTSSTEFPFRFRRRMNEQTIGFGRNACVLSVRRDFSRKYIKIKMLSNVHILTIDRVVNQRISAALLLSAGHVDE